VTQEALHALPRVAGPTEAAWVVLARLGVPRSRDEPATARAAHGKSRMIYLPRLGKVSEAATATQLPRNDGWRLDRAWWRAARTPVPQLPSLRARPVLAAARPGTVAGRWPSGPAQRERTGGGRVHSRLRAGRAAAGGGGAGGWPSPSPIAGAECWRASRHRAPCPPKQSLPPVWPVRRLRRSTTRSGGSDRPARAVPARGSPGCSPPGNRPVSHGRPRAPRSCSCRRRPAARPSRYVPIVQQIIGKSTIS
jgi:hypothetical protein